jgi:hypothetical protein
MRSSAILLVALCVCATEVRAESASGTARIERLVVELDDDAFQVREAAERELVKLAEVAVAVSNCRAFGLSQFVTLTGILCGPWPSCSGRSPRHSC